MGDWKVIRKNLKTDKEEPTLELYHLGNDPKELNNVASDHPEIINRAVEIFKREHQNAALDRFRIPAVETGLLNAN